MYTEILIKANIREDLPIEAKEVLEYLFLGKTMPTILPKHDLFETTRWRLIGNCNSFYHIPQVFNFFSGTQLFSRSDLKNNGCVIELFFDWIQPYINAEIGVCIGYKWYEEHDAPTLMYKCK